MIEIYARLFDARRPGVLSREIARARIVNVETDRETGTATYEIHLHDDRCVPAVQLVRVEDWPRSRPVFELLGAAIKALRGSGNAE